MFPKPKPLAFAIRVAIVERYGLHHLHRPIA